MQIKKGCWFFWICYKLLNWLRIFFLPVCQIDKSIRRDPDCQEVFPDRRWRLVEKISTFLYRQFSLSAVFLSENLLFHIKRIGQIPGQNVSFYLLIQYSQSKNSWTYLPRITRPICTLVLLFEAELASILALSSSAGIMVRKQAKSWSPMHRFFRSEVSKNKLHFFRIYLSNFNFVS